MKKNKLLCIREELGITQQYMAKLLGITAPAYSMKENGKRKFSPQEMGLIFKLFNSMRPTLDMQDIFL